MPPTIRAVIADEWGKPLVKEVPAAEADPATEIKLKVVASGLHQFVRLRANGGNYSAQTLPHKLGIDGVGKTEDGKLVWFNSLGFGGGGFGDEIVAPVKLTRPLPEGADPYQLAALMNPALASWQSLTTRWAARDNYPNGFKVLILGATSAAGQVGARLSRHRGATSVIGAARTAEKVKETGLFDGAIAFGAGEAKDIDWSAAKDVDLILDFISGPVVISLFNALPSIRPITFIQLGALSGHQSIDVPLGVLRGKNLTIVGSGPGAWDPVRDGAAQLQPQLDALVASGAKWDNLKIVKLADFVETYHAAPVPGQRIVFVP